MQTGTNHKSLSTIILVGALLITALTLFYTLRFFIDAFLGALIFYVLFRKFQRFLSEKKKWRIGLAAVLIILISFLVIVIPIIVVLDLIVPRISLFFSEGSITMSAIKELDDKLGAATGYQLLTEQNIQNVQEKAGEFITGFFSTSINILTSLLLMYFVLFYMLVNTGNMERIIFQYLPFKRKHHQKIYRRTGDADFVERNWSAAACTGAGIGGGFRILVFRNQ